LAACSFDTSGVDNSTLDAAFADASAVVDANAVVDAALVDANTLVDAGAPGSSAELAASSCNDVLAGGGSVGDGLYWLDPNGGDTTDAFQTFCDMTTSGGGWTVLFTAADSDLNSNSLDYTILDPELPAGAADVLLAYRSGQMGLLPGWAIFPIPSNWRTQSPLTYQAQTESIQVSIEGSGPTPATLYYGHATWNTNFCSGSFLTGADFGLICLSGTTGPMYSGFAHSDNDQCTASDQFWAAQACTSDRRFTIAVR